MLRFEREKVVLLGRLKEAEDAVSASAVSGAAVAGSSAAQAPVMKMATEEAYALKSQIFSLENEVHVQ